MVFLHHAARRWAFFEAGNGGHSGPGVVQIARFKAKLGGRRVFDWKDMDFFVAARFISPVGVALEHGALLWNPFG